jgi:hypothetical protein
VIEDTKTSFLHSAGCLRVAPLCSRGAVDVLSDSTFWALVVVQGIKSLTDVYLARKKPPGKGKGPKHGLTSL